jgi:histidinol-phosphate aminotransferase
MERRAFMHSGLALGVASFVGIPRSRLHANTTSRGGVADGPIKLSSNENALGLCPDARQAVIDGIEHANRYPRESRRAVIEALAAKHNVSSDCIILGNGSTEVLQMMVQATASRRTKLIAAEPTFEAVTGYSLPETYVRETVPLDDRLAHDIGRMRELAERSWDPVLAYVCNPNNPTGTLTPCSEVDEWIDSAPENVRFLVDEAYFEYVNDPTYSSCTKWIMDRPNVVVARTFSKIYGMAGIRLGYGVAHPRTVEHLAQFAADTNTNELALRAGLASLNDQGLVARSVEINRQGADIVREVLGDLGLEVLPSHTNFVMHRISGELQTYIGRMREHGILVGRPFPPMLTYNRLSIGLPEEMARFAETLREFRRAGWV